jgi:acylphosphatase
MKADTERAQARLIITGRVQGVYFRASTVEEARRLDLTGWVRNCPDGSVEALAEGARPMVEKLIAWCHQGPPGARVKRVEVTWQKPANNLERFTIKR